MCVCRLLFIADYVASQSSTATLTPAHSAAGLEGELGGYWHARQLIDGKPSPQSLCGIFTWTEGQAVPTVSWRARRVKPRCAACQDKVDHPSAFAENDLWDKNGSRCLDLCVVCSQPAASHVTGPHGVLSRTFRGGHVSNQLVAVHEGCQEQAASLAQEQGYGWQFPPPLGWDHQAIP
jgi:hypothetical protein